MKGAWCVVVLAAVLTACPLALAKGLGDVDATVRVQPRQDQAGKVIRVTAAVAANTEAVTVNGRGRVRVGGNWVALQPKATPWTITPAGGFNLKLIPSPAVAKRIAEELNAGRHPPARFTVVLSDAAGSVEESSYRVRLTR